MKIKNQRSRKWMLSFFMVSLMLFSVFIGMAGSAQDERPNDENNEQEVTGMIVGVVIDFEANPIAGAVAYLTHAEDNTKTEKRQLKAETNERGYFEFSELPRGLYFLKVVTRGYKEWHREVKLPAEETIKLEIKLEKLEEKPNEPEPEENNNITYGKVFGYVFNAVEEEPIGGALVIIHHLKNERELKLETNERGWFEAKLPRGKYVIVVEARGFWPYKEELIVRGNDEQKLRIPMRPREPEVRPTLCGHIFDAETDKPIFGWVEISQGSPEIPFPNKDKKDWYKEKERYGKTRQAENDKPTEESEENSETVYGKIIGYVYNALEEEPIGGAIVIIHSLESERELKLETNERGMFEAKLPRGKYVIVVEARGFWPYKEELVVRGDTEQKMRIQMKPREHDEVPERPEKPEDYKLWRTFTDRGGWYEYFEIPPGHYEIRAFAHGHIMFYNEIDIEEDSHIYLDIYLLRDPCPPKPEPKPVPMSYIAGHVFNARTTDPVAGAIVCAIPIRVIKDRMDDVKVDDLGLDEAQLKDLGIDIDWNNIDFNQDVDVDYSDMGSEEFQEYQKDEDWDKEKKEYSDEKPEEPYYDKSDYDKSDKTRCCNDRPKEEPECDRDIKRKKRLFRFCTKTDDDGNFKLKIPAGYYVLLVKARGYKLFAHRFSIKPNQKMWIRVPLKPMDQDNNEYDENKPFGDLDRPMPKDRPGNVKDDPDRKTGESSESSETQSLGAGTGASIAPLSESILASTLGILTIIAMILGAAVWRKHNLSDKLKSKKGDK